MQKIRVLCLGSSNPKPITLEISKFSLTEVPREPNTSNQGLWGFPSSRGSFEGGAGICRGYKGDIYRLKGFHERVVLFNLLGVT